MIKFFSTKGLKLTDKGLLIVAIPLFLELVFLLVLSYLTSVADEQSRRLDYYKNLMATADSITKSFYDAINTTFLYGTTHNEEAGERYNQLTWQISEKLDQLREAVADKPQHRKALARVLIVANDCLYMLDDTRTQLNQSSGFSLLSGGLKLPHHIISYIGEMVTELNNFVEELKGAETVTPERAERLKTTVHWCLALGCLVTLAFIVTALAFFRQITRRLENLMDNTSRLARDEPLLPALAGSDELATLDRVFHEMAFALDEAARKERAVVENAVDVILSLDRQGRFLKLNPAATTVFAYKPEELAGKSLSSIVMGDDLAQILAAFESIKNSHGSVSIETRVTRGDGKTVHILWSAQWSAFDQCWFCVAHDISQRKELEELKQQFVAMVSHDLRTPLTSLKGYFDLARQGAYGALSDQGMARTISAGSNLQRLIGLVNDLLDLEKLEAGKLQLNCTDVEMLTAMERAADAVQGYAEEQEVRLEIVPTDALAYADEERLIQVLVNLIGNAIKFSPSDTTVTVSAQTADGWTEVRVADQGRGIPESFRPAVFERFQQVEADDATVKKGVGLGLTISKAIIDAHGGTIGVESEVGKGSVFWFRVRNDLMPPPEVAPAAIAGG